MSALCQKRTLDQDSKAILKLPLRYPKNKKGLAIMLTLCLHGAPGAIRTPDPLVRSQVLYPTELRALKWIIKLFLVFFINLSIKLYQTAKYNFDNS